MRIRLLTFDLDDTLWEVEPVLRRAEEAQRRWLETHRPAVVDHLEPTAYQALRRSVWERHRSLAHDLGAMRRALLAELQRRAGYDEPKSAEGAAEAFAVFLEERQRVEPDPAALPVLTELAARYRIGALSNGNADIYLTALAPCFEFAFSAADVGASKPAPALFEAALASTGVDAPSSVHIGDHPEHDVEAARRVGLKTIWLNNRGRKWREVGGDLQPADVEITTLEALPQALTRLEATEVSTARGS